jgi:hypothetical protein
MKTSHRFIVGLTFALVLIVGLALRYFLPKHPRTQSAAVTASVPVPTSAPSVTPAPVAAPTVTPPPPVPENEVEAAATARMYAAHAPLRTPELADPDSQSNKRILQTMVQKALAQSAAPSGR